MKIFLKWETPTFLHHTNELTFYYISVSQTIITDTNRAEHP